MTFGAEEMIVLLMLAAYLFFFGTGLEARGMGVRRRARDFDAAGIDAQHFSAGVPGRAALLVLVLAQVAGGCGSGSRGVGVSGSAADLEGAGEVDCRAARPDGFQ